MPVVIYCLSDPNVPFLAHSTKAYLGPLNIPPRPQLYECALSIEDSERLYRRKRFFLPGSMYSFDRLLQCAWFLQGLTPTARAAGLVPSS